MLIGLGTVTVVALVAAIRSGLPNKALILVMWAVYTAFSFGIRL